MAFLYSLCTASALVVALGACASAPPGPLAQGHPARADAPVLPFEPAASALRHYREFRAEAAKSVEPTPEHSMHQDQQFPEPTRLAPGEEEGHEHNH
jgi:hypothetical protein